MSAWQSPLLLEAPMRWLVLGVLVVLAVALSAVLAWLVRVIERQRRKAQPSPPPRPGPTDSKMAAIEERLAAIENSLKAFGESQAGMNTSIRSELNSVVEVLAERAGRAKGPAPKLNELAVVYEEALKCLEPRLQVVLELRPAAGQLAAFAGDPKVAGIIREYGNLANLRDAVAGLHQDVLQQMVPRQPGTETLAIDFRQGRITAGEYLRAIFAPDSSSGRQFPAPADEKARLQGLAESLEERVLQWIDSVNDLREDAAVAGNQELHSACCGVIEQAAETLRQWNIEIIDVAVGDTRFDQRLHDLASPIPRTDVPPETIIGVRRLGRSRNGAPERKPEVLVAAAPASASA